MTRDVVAGVLLANGVPHAILGCAGKRGMTPLGRGDSSPGLNLAWAGMNLAGALALLAAGGWRRAEQAEADRRIAGVAGGMLAMTTFAIAYTAVTSRPRAARL
jgi:hypothetical protein